MAELGVVDQDDEGSFRLVESDIGQAGVSALAEAYQSRKDHDREKLDSMIAYAQRALCRWHLILRVFGESLESGECGACDNCRKSAERARLAAAS